MSARSVTQLLQEWSAGKSEALDELLPLVYDELRRLAARCLRSERTGHTLRATDLVHEAYLRLVDADVEWQSRVHFYAVAARVVRRVLVEYARSRNREKRGRGAEKIPLDEAVIIGPEAEAIVLELDEALQRLAQLDARKSEIIELIYFGGLTYEETGAALNLSAATIDRELRMAKAWLYRELGQNPAQGTHA